MCHQAGERFVSGATRYESSWCWKEKGNQGDDVDSDNGDGAGDDDDDDDDDGGGDDAHQLHFTHGVVTGRRDAVFDFDAKVGVERRSVAGRRNQPMNNALIAVDSQPLRMSRVIYELESSTADHAQIYGVVRWKKNRNLNDPMKRLVSFINIRRNRNHGNMRRGAILNVFPSEFG